MSCALEYSSARCCGACPSSGSCWACTSRRRSSASSRSRGSLTAWPRAASRTSSGGAWSAWRQHRGHPRRRRARLLAAGRRGAAHLPQRAPSPRRSTRGERRLAHLCLRRARSHPVRHERHAHRRGGVLALALGRRAARGARRPPERLGPLPRRRPAPLQERLRGRAGLELRGRRRWGGGDVRRPRALAHAHGRGGPGWRGAGGPALAARRAPAGRAHHRARAGRRAHRHRRSRRAHRAHHARRDWHRRRHAGGDARAAALARRAHADDAGRHRARGAKSARRPPALRRPPARGAAR